LKGPGAPHLAQSHLRSPHSAHSHRSDARRRRAAELGYPSIRRLHNNGWWPA
jgi:hypothetical protein